MNIDNLSTDSCKELFYNLDNYRRGNMRDDPEHVYSSTYSGWIPLVSILSNLETDTAIRTDRPLTIPYLGIYYNDFPYAISVFGEFNESFKSHTLNWKHFKYIVSGEIVEFYVGPGIILYRDSRGVFKTLFMICLSNELFLDIRRGDRNKVTKSGDVKLFMDYDMMTFKYQKIYKIIETLYIVPLLEKGVEMCIKSSELFMDEVMGNEFTPVIVSQEEFEEFNRIIREEVI